jgi:hypothetical protein
MSFSIAATTLPYASVFGYRTILFILFHMMVALYGMATVIVFFFFWGGGSAISWAPVLFVALRQASLSEKKKMMGGFRGDNCCGNI